MNSAGDGQRVVLVVEDDAGARSLLSMIFMHEGYTVFEAADGLEAVEELKKRPFHAVISDYHMPQFNGMQLLAICRILWPETAVIIISGEDSDWTDRALRGGACAWSKKPYERSQLTGLVREAMEKVVLRDVTVQVHT